jgi:hypothetical protein
VQFQVKRQRQADLARIGGPEKPVVGRWSLVFGQTNNEVADDSHMIVVSLRPLILANDQGPTTKTYLLYNSTINCSFTGRLMSSRLGKARTLPL